MNNSFRDICHKVAADATKKSLRDNEIEFLRSPATRAKHLRLLQDVVLESGNKTLANRLGISEATLSQWVTGDREIPPMRQIEILREARFFVKSKLKKLIEIDDYVEMLEAMQFGEVPRD